MTYEELLKAIVFKIVEVTVADETHEIIWDNLRLPKGALRYKVNFYVKTDDNEQALGDVHESIAKFIFTDWIKRNTKGIYTSLQVMQKRYNKSAAALTSDLFTFT
jgi:hypothetical protein